MAGSSTDCGQVLWRELVRAQGVVLPRLHKALRRRHGLSLTELVVLQALGTTGRRPTTMTHVQQAAHLSAAGTTRVVTALEARGLVTRARREQDRRLLYVRATEEGRAMTLQAQQTVDEVMAGLVGKAGAGAEIAVAAKVLASLSAAATDDEP